MGKAMVIAAIMANAMLVKKRMVFLLRVAMLRKVCGTF
jgi:hypothetical protein